MIPPTLFPLLQVTQSEEGPYKDGHIAEIVRNPTSLNELSCSEIFFKPKQ